MRGRRKLRTSAGNGFQPHKQAMQMTKSIIENNALASSQETGNLPNNEPIELEIQITKASPIVRAALEFYAMRNNQTVDQFCKDAILCALEGCEDQSDGYFSKLREAAAQ